MLTAPVVKLTRRITRLGFDAPINAAVGKRTLRVPFAYVHRTRFLASGRDCSMPLDTSGASAAF
jgi:hypothetical protein